MVDRPILFSGPMVRALLGGRKTQTRRILKPQPHGDVIQFGWQRDSGATWTDQAFETRRLPCWAGDRLWVREAWRTGVKYDGMSPKAIVSDALPFNFVPVFYDAGEKPLAAGRARASMHMPRAFSRITLYVEDVKVERLQDISEEDARAEGAMLAWTGSPGTACDDTRSPRSEFEALWNSINGDGSWDANPWICAIDFRVEPANIDASPTPSRLSQGDAS